jgi:predicted regulator of Ras-like GTPase activity (Roadblock/LC7/MglB family)
MSALKEKITGIVEKIHNISGVQSCALISRDGVLLGNDTVSDSNEAWFAAMCATILASAESIAVIVKSESPRHIIIQTPNGSTIIMGSGEKLLVAVHMDSSADPNKTYEALYAIAEEIAGSF